jgi:hypothetical protein
MLLKMSLLKVRIMSLKEAGISSGSLSLPSIVFIPRFLLSDAIRRRKAAGDGSLTYLIKIM